MRYNVTWHHEQDHLLHRTIYRRIWSTRTRRSGLVHGQLHTEIRRHRRVPPTLSMPGDLAEFIYARRSAAIVHFSSVNAARRLRTCARTAQVAQKKKKKKKEHLHERKNSARAHGHTHTARRRSIHTRRLLPGAEGTLTQVHLR